MGMEPHFQDTCPYPQTANNIYELPRQFSCIQSLQLIAELRPEQFRKSKQGWCTKPFQLLRLQVRDPSTIAAAAKALAAHTGMQEQRCRSREAKLQLLCGEPDELAHNEAA